jgi:hypothetical protein
MSSTAQEPNPAANPGASPAQAAGEGTARTVPLGEHIQLRQEHTDLRQQFRSLQDQVAKLTGQAVNSPAPAPAAPPVTPASDPLRDLQRRAAIDDLSLELGVDRKQASAVHDILDANPKLSAIEAKQLAAMRAPDLFKGHDDGFQHGTHAAARPGIAIPAVPRPQVDPFEDRLNKIGNMKVKRTQQAFFNNLMGSIAAEDVGKTDHQLMPLPQ